MERLNSAKDVFRHVARKTNLNFGIKDTSELYLSEEGIRAIERDYEENYYISMERKPKASLSFIGRMGQGADRAARAFASPFLWPVRQFRTREERAMGVLAAVAIVVIPIVPILKGFANIYNTFKNKADYHPIDGRTNYNQMLSKALSSGKDSKEAKMLNKDRDELTVERVESMNTDLAQIAIRETIQAIIDSGGKIDKLVQSKPVEDKADNNVTDVNSSTNTSTNTTRTSTNTTRSTTKNFVGSNMPTNKSNELTDLNLNNQNTIKNKN